MAVQGVPVKVMGFRVTTYSPECPAEVAGDHQDVPVVVAEPVAPLLAQTTCQIMAGACIAA